MYRFFGGAFEHFPDDFEITALPIVAGLQNCWKRF
jgi:hypothetical protein